MLNENQLANNFKDTFKNILCPVFETALLEFLPSKSEDGTEKCAQFKECLMENLCEPLATALASAIHMYVKQISINGTIITTGSPFTQTAVISSNFIPIVNGTVPNSLGIS